MEFITTLPTGILHHYLSVVFAQANDATLVMAMFYAFAAFSGMYFSAATIAWWYVKKPNTNKKINSHSLKLHQIRAEIFSSLISILMFVLLTGLTFLLLQKGWLQVKGEVSIAQWSLEVLALFLWNEAHFYTTHRILHTKWLYRHVHINHHFSVVVTPFAVYRFHWLEALLLGAVMPLAMIFHEFSIWSLLLLPPLSLAWNIIGHSNYRPTHKNLKWFARASERHAIHHAKFQGNYGFSLPQFDQWFNTTLM